ncbi:hypothetical protein AAF712_005292 [Marasmius tenuissimus]|uniref:Small ribosomal subunit protein bS18m n=1 Tax=Marasmius tenuissimus TaxID=585030 RepID=A0ABR3A0V8_9AGAR
MFAAFRQAAQRPTSVSRAFSSTSGLANSIQNGNGGFAVLRKTVNETANKVQGSTFQRSPNSPFRSFEANSFITPDRLKYDNVLKGSKRRTTRPRVGPSKHEARKKDPFYQLNIDPLTMALNPYVLNNYVSDMGKIFGRNITNLTMKNQRRLGKAIRRAKMMGVIPVLSKRNIFHSNTLHVPTGNARVPTGNARV